MNNELKYNLHGLMLVVLVFIGIGSYRFYNNPETLDYHPAAPEAICMLLADSKAIREFPSAEWTEITRAWASGWNAGYYCR